MSHKLHYYLSIIILLTSCIREYKTFEVNGTLSKSKGEWIYLKEMTAKDYIVKDSAQINKKGNFSLKSKVKYPAFYSLYISKNNNITLAVYPKDEILINGDARDLYSTSTIEGSDDSERIRKLTEHLNRNIERLKELANTYQESLGDPDILLIKKQLDSVFYTIESDQIEFTKAFIKENPGSLASLMALHQNISPRKPVLNPIEDYTYFKMVDSALMKVYPLSEPVKILHERIINIEQRLKEKKIIEQKLNIGKVAPDIILPSSIGDTVALSSLKGKYVLLDFWASWCEDCRAESPNIVRNYYKYWRKGFELYQVSLDKSKSSWLNAIEIDKRRGIHVSDLKFWNSEIVAIYGIEGIPLNYLLDREGRIIAKNITGDELSKKLEEIFGK